MAAVDYSILGWALSIGYVVAEDPRPVFALLLLTDLPGREQASVSAGDKMLVPIRLETIAVDLATGARRIVTGRPDLPGEPGVTLARLDFFGELAEIARTSPTFQRDLIVFLTTALAPKSE